ncbi:hypothetical protein EPH_0063010 [Eimeria praecox]|uniref:Uncharacterized protein n=1 Tax=Eimeria praecox TaxID=51316 RepID=U6H2Y7_9EIME|nr:hypothetical protein EPH_0063010 [Eimeria praecox]
MYKTHTGSLFAGEGFHSYTPFEEKGGKSLGRKLSSKENPFCPPVRWRSSEDHNSCIRLTSLKAKAAREANQHPPEVIRPLEFCDIEADASSSRDRSDTIDDNLWEGPQSDFQADTWDEDTTTMLNGQNGEEYSTPQGNEHYTPQGNEHYGQFPGGNYEPF